MDWWQAASLMGTFVATAIAVAAFCWRILERIRQENREAHEKIGDKISRVQEGLRAEIAQVPVGLRAEIAQSQDGLRAEIAQSQDGLRAEIAGVRDSLGAEIAQLRDGQTRLHTGLGEIRGELKGVTSSLQDLREDFRAHVFAGQD